MNPLKIFEYDPLDRTKLNWGGKVAAWLIEYIARIIGSVYLAIALMLVALWPKRSASKTFFRMIGSVADMYRMKWMPEEMEKGETKDGSKGLANADDRKVSGVANKQ